MLKSLYIKNYALIENLELDFQKGLNVITGETGAGKSIIIGALGLILGNRADTTVLNQQSGKCVIEGDFGMENGAVKDFLLERELDVEEDLRIRREITLTGKSRAFINDTPVGLSDLKELASLLVDVNAQNQSYIFKDSDFQLSMLDDLAETNSVLLDYQEKYGKFIRDKKSLDRLVAQENEARQQQDFLQFQCDELSEAQLKEGEEEQLRSDLEWMDNAETIKQSLYYTTQALSQGDEALVGQLETVLSQLSPLQKLHPKYEDLQKRLESNLIEIQDLASEYEQLFEQTEFNPEQHAIYQERLDLILHLQQKHRKQNVDELIQYWNELEEQLLEFNSLGDKIAALQSDLGKQQKHLLKLAEKLSKGRQKSIKSVEQRVVQGLQELGMKDAEFVVDFKILDSFTRTGLNKLDFLFSSNKGRQADLVSKIASGGELSRLVLTLKSLLSANRNLPTVIFDEIDTGVSGDIASKVGDVMRQMANNMQLITITHLPQIAAKGHSHYKVYKKEVNKVTHSDIRMLQDAERLAELALMLSGDATSASALKMAEDLINKN